MWCCVQVWKSRHTKGFTCHGCATGRHETQNCSGWRINSVLNFQYAFASIGCHDRYGKGHPRFAKTWLQNSTEVVFKGFVSNRHEHVVSDCTRAQKLFRACWDICTGHSGASQNRRTTFASLRSIQKATARGQENTRFRGSRDRCWDGRLRNQAT